MLYEIRITQNKSDLINSILQHGRAVDNIIMQYFLLQNFHIDTVFLIVQMEGSFHLLSCKD